MSRPRDRWWSYVKNIIRDYPKLEQLHNERRRADIIPAYGDGAHSGNTSDQTHIAATRGLSAWEEREYDAVRRAVEITERYHNGYHRMKIISGAYWEMGERRLRYLALSIPCSEQTAKKWNREFIRLVASLLGFLD